MSRTYFRMHLARTDEWQWFYFASISGCGCDTGVLALGAVLLSHLVRAGNGLPAAALLLSALFGYHMEHFVHNKARPSMTRCSAIQNLRTTHVGLGSVGGLWSRRPQDAACKGRHLGIKFMA